MIFFLYKSLNLGIEYEGQDPDRKVLKFLSGIAKVIKDGEGEIECEITKDGFDPCFEFYTIKDSKVYIQPGKIVKKQKVLADIDYIEKNQPFIELYGYERRTLNFKELNKQQLNRLKAIQKTFFNLKFDSTSLSYGYEGRDTSRKVLRLYNELAKIIKNAEGEIICEPVNDEGFRSFEFYTIKDGQLYQEKGIVVREQEKEIGF